MEPSVPVPAVPAVTFRLPPQLEGLRRLAYNFYWSWHPAAKNLFERIDPAGAVVSATHDTPAEPLGR